MMTDILVNFFHAGAVVFAGLFGLWAISVIARNASFIDIYWGFGFLIVGAVCLYLINPKTDYIWLMGLMPIIWGARLTLYLAGRNLGHGEDKRYVAMRKRAEKKGMSEMIWRLRSLLTIYFGQGILIMIVSAPIWVAMATGKDISNLGVLALIGAIMWLIGFLFEAVGDWQLARFIKANRGYDGPIESKPVMDKGLWKYTRHPNYFGNALMWWGIWVAVCAAPFGWATIFAPLIMTFLLTRVSGRDLLERDMGRRKSYQDYMARTSGFIPKPPKKI